MMIRSLFVGCILASVLMAFSGCPAKKQNVQAQRKVLGFGKNHKAWRTLTARPVLSVHHGESEQEIFANDMALRVSSGKQDPPYPEGSVFVMLRYKDGKPLSKAYVMRKMGSGYHEDYGNWRYTVVRVSDWTVERDGKLVDCIQCHFEKTKTNDRDFVPLKKSDGL